MGKVETYEVKFGTIDVYELFMVVTPHAHVDMGLEELRTLKAVADRHYTGPFGYIANRKNRNSVDIRLHLGARKQVPLWSSLAVVAYSKHTRALGGLEKAVLGNFPFRLFTSLDEAMEWATDHILELRQTPLPSGKSERSSMEDQRAESPFSAQSPAAPKVRNNKARGNAVELAKPKINP